MYPRRVTEAESPRVFVSYSHDSTEHQGRVIGLSQRLRGDGVDAWLDVFETAPPEGWPQWMKKELLRANHVLVVCTETYKRRWDGEEVAGKGLGVAWEASLTRQLLYDASSRNERFIPILIGECSDECVPLELRPYTRYRIPAQYEDLWRHLTDQPKVIPAPLGTKELPAALPALEAQPVRSFGMEEGQIETLFAETLELEGKVRQTKDVMLAIKAADKLHAIADLLNALVAGVPDGTPGDALTTTRRAQREYFLGHEQEMLSWVYYEKRDLDQADAAAEKSIQHMAKALQYVHAASGNASDKEHLADKAKTWGLNRRFMESMQAAIRARREWEQGEPAVAMDFHKRSAALAEEAAEYAEAQKLDPLFTRVLLGNLYGMQANAAQSAVRVLQARALKGDVRAGLEAIRLQIEAQRLFRRLLHVNPEDPQAGVAMGMLERNVRGFLAGNRSHWGKLYGEFSDFPEVHDAMRDLDAKLFQKVRSGEAN